MAIRRIVIGFVLCALAMIMSTGSVEAQEECNPCDCFCNELAKQCQSWGEADDGPYEICVNDSVSCHDSGLCLALQDVGPDGAVRRGRTAEWVGNSLRGCGHAIVARRYDAGRIAAALARLAAVDI